MKDLPLSCIFYCLSWGSKKQSIRKNAKLRMQSSQTDSMRKSFLFKGRLNKDFTNNLSHAHQDPSSFPDVPSDTIMVYNSYNHHCFFSILMTTNDGVNVLFNHLTPSGPNIAHILCKRSLPIYFPFYFLYLSKGGKMSTAAATTTI